MLINPTPATLPVTPGEGLRARPSSSIEDVARSFEAVMLAQLLKATGADRPLSEFGGGIGEDQLSSMLLEARAEHVAARRGLGLAEMVLRRDQFDRRAMEVSHEDR